MSLNRRDCLKGILGSTFVTAAGATLTGCVTQGVARAPALAGDFLWGALLHLGNNMWMDWTPDGIYPKSFEEEAQWVKDGKLKFEETHLDCNRDYFSTNWQSWRKQVDCIKEEGLNTVLIDLGEAYAYPSHPELWVKGSLSPAQMRKELARIRALGLEPIPKINFSTGHDQWLREYHYMTSSKVYYRVVADVIRDTCEVFDFPRYFHLGFDEEIFVACSSRQACVMRQGDLWWKDVLFCVGEVEKHGARAMLWSDKVCSGREDFFKNMPKSVLQMTWYYGTDFSEENLKWKPEFEKSQGWDSQKNLASSIVELSKAGYDIMPCTSNWSSDEAADVMLGFCRKHIDPARVKGYFTAPWMKPVPEDDARALAGIRLFAEAKRKHFGV